MGIRLALALVVPLLLVELALHAFPGILPRAYLRTYPMRGVEFFHPGLLERTPIEGVPLPLMARAYEGPPPSDLQELGLVPQAERGDRLRFPDVRIPADAMGFPNLAVRERADILLVGDSFAVAAGLTEPPGLQVRLAEATGLVVHNLGVAGIGPVREEWLLVNHGLPMEPRCVLWFFFAGNDTGDSIHPLVHRREGRDTFAAVHADRRPPRFILPDLLRTWFAARGRAASEPLPGFLFTCSDGSRRPIWFNPPHLRLLELDRDRWAKHIAWKTTAEVLLRARDACEGAGAGFVLVYVPSKAEVYLPWVVADSELLHRTAGFRSTKPPSQVPAAYLETLLANRGSLEEVVRALCASNDIPFHSARPGLEAQAARGELGYLAADTHWGATGQLVLLEPLLELLGDEGVLAE